MTGLTWTIAAIAEPQFHLQDLVNIVEATAGLAWLAVAGTAGLLGVIAFLYSLKYGWGIFSLAVALELPLLVTFAVAYAMDADGRKVRDGQCRTSQVCRQSGLCSAGTADGAPGTAGACRAASDPDCKASSGCATDGKCTAENGVCTWPTADSIGRLGPSAR